MNPVQEQSKLYNINISDHVQIKVDIPNKKLEELTDDYLKTHGVKNNIEFFVLFIFNPLFLLVSNICLFYDLSENIPYIYYLFNFCTLLIYIPFCMLFAVKSYKAHSYLTIYAIIIKIVTGIFQLVSFIIINIYMSLEASIFIAVSYILLLMCMAHEIYLKIKFAPYVHNKCRQQYYQEMQNASALSDTLLLK